MSTRAARAAALLTVVLLAAPAAVVCGRARLHSPLGAAQRRHVVVRTALAQRGVPYRWGGDSHRGFDCSGLVRFVYARVGLVLPHSSYAQADAGRRVRRESLRAGDLVFFDRDGHVGIYVGRGRFVHAPHPGGHVEVSSLRAGWYAQRYVGARRVLPPVTG